jgi:hypothetical protein
LARYPGAGILQRNDNGSPAWTALAREKCGNAAKENRGE